MNLGRVEAIAKAVLYEGYMLYPYRPSSIKNQQRWNFGVLCPRSYCEQQDGSESWTMQTECLVKVTPSSQVVVKIRFLQIVQRSIGKLHTPSREPPEGPDPEFDLVDCLEVNGRILQPWQEAVERDHSFGPFDPALLSSYSPLRIAFPAGRQLEYQQDERGRTIGVIVREWEALTVSIEFASELCHDGVAKVAVRVSNLTPLDPSLTSRGSVIPFSLVSANTILGIEQGAFISLLDPPAAFHDLAAGCSNIGTWPVLVGDEAETVLSSPIILYDHPQIAPESAGDLFDTTEIDEILSLRILTLTDDEKREMQQSDERAREILERTEQMPEEQFIKLHGVLRGLTPLKEVER